MASLTQWEILCFDVASPWRPAPKQTNNWEDFLQTLERSTYSFNARTRQSMWSLSSSLEAKGGGWKGWSVTTWEWNDVDKTLGMEPGLGCRVTLTRPGAKSIHVSLTEKACKSPTLFSDVSASKRTTLRVSIQSEADSKGSKGAVTRPSRTTDKSQEGTAMGRAGLSRLTPRIKVETIRCLPRGTSSSSLRAAMAAT